MRYAYFYNYAVLSDSADIHFPLPKPAQSDQGKSERLSEEKSREDNFRVIENNKGEMKDNQRGQFKSEDHHKERTNVQTDRQWVERRQV